MGSWELLIYKLFPNPYVPATSVSVSDKGDKTQPRHHQSLATHLTQRSNSRSHYSELFLIFLKSKISMFSKREEYEGKVRDKL